MYNFFGLPGKPCCLSDVEVKLDLDESFFLKILQGNKTKQFVRMKSHRKVTSYITVGGKFLSRSAEAFPGNRRGSELCVCYTIVIKWQILWQRLWQILCSLESFSILYIHVHWKILIQKQILITIWWWFEHTCPYRNEDDDEDYVEDGEDYDKDDIMKMKTWPFVLPGLLQEHCKPSSVQPPFLPPPCWIVIKASGFLLLQNV